MSPVLKDLSSGPPKPTESVPERMDGEFISIDTRTKKVIRASRGHKYLVKKDDTGHHDIYRWVLPLKGVR